MIITMQTNNFPQPTMSGYFSPTTLIENEKNAMLSSGHATDEPNEADSFYTPWQENHVVAEPKFQRSSTDETQTAPMF